MKQKLISYLSTIKDEILTLNKYLYDNPENCFNEFNSSKYIINLLKKHDFEVKENFLNIPTSFLAKVGNEEPCICFICKYSSGDENGHVFGNNSNAAISIGASIALASITKEIGGSVVLIGCPGRYSNGSEITMTHDKVFDDVDVIFAPHVDNSNAESGTSMATIPLKIDFKFENTNSNRGFKNTALDACLHTTSFVNEIVKHSCQDCYIDNLLIEGNNNLHDLPSSCTTKFQIKSSNISQCHIIEEKIRTYIKALQPVVDVNHSVSLYELPCKELITNSTLSRIFSNNMKECGIIEIHGPKNVVYPLGIGTVSHTTPTIYPSICIVEDKTIPCPSIKFKEATISEFAEDKIYKAIESLAITGIDFIERKDLVAEITAELNHHLKK